MDMTVESTFMVTIRSTNVGAGLMDRVRDQQTKNLLRSLELGIGRSCQVYELEGTHDDDLYRVGVPVAYDSFADDMGNHPGHDTVVIRRNPA